MNNIEAHRILGSSSEYEADVIQELIEEQTFNLRAYFLTNPTIVPLFKSRIAKLSVIHEASHTLGLSAEDQTDSQEPLLWDLSSNNIEELIRDYETQKIELKLKLSSVMLPLEIAHYAELLCRLELEFMDKFWNLSHEFEVPEEPIKAAEVPDYGDFIFELQKKSTRSKQMVVKERGRIKALLKKD